MTQSHKRYIHTGNKAQSAIFQQQESVACHIWNDRCVWIAIQCNDRLIEAWDCPPECVQPRFGAIAGCQIAAISLSLHCVGWAAVHTHTHTYTPVISDGAICRRLSLEMAGCSNHQWECSVKDDFNYLKTPLSIGSLTPVQADLFPLYLALHQSQAMGCVLLRYAISVLLLQTFMFVFDYMGLIY